ncbi:hypothetical protein ACFFIX_23395 [Metabacillus herbersteinensis]|uniref:Uncharacterized protein n=1 Tax=Metabacillus herbersteinensis TaxID=283816 RepID=A0ABV6GKS8_9BACI
MSGFHEEFFVVAVVFFKTGYSRKTNQVNKFLYTKGVLNLLLISHTFLPYDEVAITL